MSQRLVEVRERKLEEAQNPTVRMRVEVVVVRKTEADALHRRIARILDLSDVSLGQSRGEVEHLPAEKIPARLDKVFHPRRRMPGGLGPATGPRLNLREVAEHFLDRRVRAVPLVLGQFLLEHPARLVKPP